ncbi:MAG: GntR family transcriptional regulator [Desulfobacteraceae bacterium]
MNENEKRFTMDMLNTQSPIPLYRQLADLLTARIREGVYLPGGRIPSEHQLAATFGIGRPTARQAIDLLVRKGLLMRKRGAGTFVCEAQQEVDLFSLDGTSASFRKKGLHVKTRIITPIHLRTRDDDGDNPLKAQPAFFLSRLTRVNQTPVLIEDLYLSATLFAGIEKMDLDGRSLSAIAEERFYLRPTSGRQSFDIGYLNGKRGQYLEINAETPVLVVKRSLHFPQRTNGVFCRLWCRTDRFVFTQNIGGVDHA